MLALPSAFWSADMAIYYFDLRDGKELIVDDEGMELSDMRAVQEEAARSMMDAARDAVLSQPAGSLAQISIEVRDDDGAVMRMGFSFDIIKKN
jgi:hypothetical protein